MKSIYVSCANLGALSVTVYAQITFLYIYNNMHALPGKGLKAKCWFNLLSVHLAIYFLF